jgi:hypothetical protein
MKMAKKYVQSLSATSVLFTDEKGNTDTFDLVAPMPKNEIVGTLSKEIAGRGDVTRGCLTVMLEMLDTPRFDTYKGKTTIGGKMDKLLKNAMSEQEVTTFQPMFYAYWDAKNPAPDGMDSAKLMAHNARRAAQWDAFISAQRDGGLYGNVKTYSLQYFAYFGMLPCVYVEGKPDKQRLMPVSAMAKAIAIAKAANVQPGLTGIAKMLADVKQALDTSTITENDIKLSYPLAVEIASILKALSDKVASDATAKAQGLPVTGVALQTGDKVQDPDTSIAQMAKVALDKASTKPAKDKKGTTPGAKPAPVDQPIQTMVNGVMVDVASL